MPIVASLVGSKVALAALALAALGGGGAAVAAAAANLPTPAHSSSSVTASPAPTEDSDDAADPTPTETPVPHSGVGPDVTGPAAFGLCTAYLAGGLGEGSTPLTSLTAIAGDGGVEAYCQLIVANGHPQSQAGHHGKPATSEHGKPATAPDRPSQSTQGTDHGSAGHHGR